MQQKKKDIQMSIQKTALAIFYQQGYPKTKMSDIAKEMNMSVGNIYTYFKNKEELFYTVVPKETIYYFEDVIAVTVQAYNDCLMNKKEPQEVIPLIAKQMILLLGNYREVVIMLDKNEGTIYEGMKDKLVKEMVDVRLGDRKTTLLDQDIRKENIPLFYKIVGSGFLDMVLMALKEEGISEEEKFELCMSLITYQLKKSQAN